MPGRGSRVAAALALTLVFTSCSDYPPERSAHPSPTAGSGSPSQSAADAKRDGVPLAIAEMSFEDRTNVPFPEPTPIRADEGVWTLTRPSAEGVNEYGEVLLLDRAQRTVVKAFPMEDGPSPMGIYRSMSWTPTPRAYGPRTTTAAPGRSSSR
jgi:hypothetical protein